jgi:uncharacterized protein YjbI with pentapeptide repeats
MNEDFRGQDLRGRSFKGLDLSYADFSNALLGSNDFRGATVTGAKFCRTNFGLSPVMQSIDFVLRMLLLSVAGVLVITCATRLPVLLAGITGGHTGIFLLVFSSIMVFFFLLALQRDRMQGLVWAILGLIVVAVSMGGSGNEKGALGLVLIAILAIVLVSVAVIATTNISLAGTVGGVLGVAFIDTGGELTQQIIVYVSVAFLFLFSFYVGRRAVLREEPQLSFLRNFSIAFRSVGASRFDGDLEAVDFTGANFEYVNFSCVKMINCKWRGVKNAHLAQIKNTLLEPRKVRDLMMDGCSSDHDFSGMSLEGANFDELDLSGFDFSHTNLSYANFNSSNLTGANLTYTNVVGAKFNKATLTDAKIQNWNIDPRTQFDEVNCTRVFLGPNQTDPNPPRGEFKAGEFSKLYQQVLDTVDFILHSPEALDAFINAVNHLKTHGDADFYVQNIERKEDSVVVKLKAPDGIDREQIYIEVQREFELKLAKLETANHYLSTHSDLLGSLLGKMVEKPINLVNKLESTIMGDNNRTQNIRDVSVNNGALNLGDNANVTNTVALTPDDQIELKNLLAELCKLITSSGLSHTDRDYAQAQVASLHDEITQNAKPEPNKIHRGLKLIQSIFTGIDTLQDTAEKAGEIVAKIGGYFS